MKEKKELLTKFNFFFLPIVEIVEEEIQSLCNFSFLKIVKIEPIIDLTNYGQFKVQK
jgi:hypothetical protein